MFKLLFITLGTLSLTLGIIGVFVPGLPTTPFLLLTASFYVRSSEKLYRRLIENKYLGHYILEYQKNKGLTKRVKASCLLMMWSMISLSVFFTIDNQYVRYLLIALAITGTVFMLFIIPTVKKPTNHSRGSQNVSPEK